MSRRALTLTTVLVAAATTGAFAFQKSLEPYNQPGRPSPANVWVQNKGPEEAIPTTLLGRSVVALEPDTTIATRTAPQAWLYRTIEVRGEDVAGGLERAGQDGWEAVGILVATPQ